MTTRNGGAAVVESLAANGVDTVFGIPGTHNLELYRHLRAAGISPITPRHEQGGGYAAEAYARVSGRPGVVVTTSGPGLTNAMTAAATAYAESQPMLLVSPGVPTGTEGRDLGLLHETKDSRAAMDHLVRWSRRVRSADEAAEAVTAAFASFAGTRPRPVHVEIPLDVLEEAWTGTARSAPATAGPAPDESAAIRAAQVLAGAQRPLIIAGGGCVGAATELTALAEAVGAPVATTVNGKGALDESHPLSVGAAVRLRALQAAAEASDALLVVGSELGDSDLWSGSIDAGDSGGTVIRIDVEAGQLQKNCRAGITLLADAAGALRAVLTALPTGRPQAADGPARAARLRDECRAEARADAGGYETVAAAVRAALPADGVLTGDSSQVTYFGSVHFFDVPAPRRFCCTPGYATLGYGLPAGIGASLGRPGAPVATLLGDGAFMFSVQELATAVELRLPLPIVVVDNGGFGEIRDQEASRGIAPVGVDMPAPDLALLATAVGAHGVRTKDPTALTGLAQDALGADRPTVIHLDWTE